MESDDHEKAVTVDEETDPGVRLAVGTGVSSRYSELGISTGASSASRTVGLPEWLEQQRHARRLPAASVVHLVPDIVVEHVSSSTFSDSGTSRQLPFGHGLCPVSAPDIREVHLSTGRQFRALSDSSVHQLKKYHMPSGIAQSPNARRGATCVTHSYGSLEFSSSGGGTFSVSDPMQLEPEMEVLYCEHTGAETVRQHGEQPSGVSHRWPVGSPYWQLSVLQPGQSVGPERSPKANWLRRHSDSNLASGYCWQAAPRVEPYPIRSHSTGDTLLNMATLMEQPVSSTAGKRPYDVSKDVNPDLAHSKEHHRTIPSHMWSAPRRTWQERASPTARMFFSEGDEQAVKRSDELWLSGRSRSDNTSSREIFARSETVGSVDRPESVLGAVRREVEIGTGVDAPGTSETSAELSPEQTKVVDMSTRTLGARSAKSEGLVEKRLKLKKYLQTRYQMSQDRLHQSSDTDDVFMEHAITPDRSESSLATPAEASEPKDLSAKSKSFTVSKSMTGDGERTRQTEVGSSHYSGLSTSLEESSHSTECGQSPLSTTEPALLLKQEPTSPGIVPSGTSVFVFPPTLPLHLEAGGWHSQPVCYQSGSPVPSPLSSSVSHVYQPVVLSPRFVQRQSYLAEEGPYHGLGPRTGHHQGMPMVSDVGAIYRRRACSLAISTSVPPLLLSEPLPSTPPHRRTVAGLEMMRISSPRARPSPAERSPHRSRSSWQWHHQHPRGRHSSSSVEDLSVFTCPVCSVVFPSYQQLTDHMADHVSVSPQPAMDAGERVDVETTGPESGGSPKAHHLCPICQRSFSRGDMLTRHVRLHTGIRPYECSLCSQVFSRSDHLTTHQRTHTGEKPYRCPLCDYAAPRRDMVTRHARIHESSSATGHRRGRRTGSSSTDRGSGGHTTRSVCGGLGSGRRTWKRSDSSGFASHQHWSPTTCDELRSSTSSSRHWSVASSSVESTDSAVVMTGSGVTSTVSSRGPPVTCRAWSTTSAESFESYPGAVHHSSSVSSAPADSPDVFMLQPRYFHWGAESSAMCQATVNASLAAAGADISEASSGGAGDVAGVMPTLQKCSVVSPAGTEHHQSTDSD